MPLETTNRSFLLQISPELNRKPPGKIPALTHKPKNLRITPWSFISFTTLVHAPERAHAHLARDVAAAARLGRRRRGWRRLGSEGITCPGSRAAHPAIMHAEWSSVGWSARWTADGRALPAAALRRPTCREGDRGQGWVSEEMGVRRSYSREESSNG